MGDLQIWSPLAANGDAVPVRSLRLQRDWDRIEQRRARAGLRGIGLGSVEPDWSRTGPSMAPNALFSGLSGLGVLGPVAQGEVDAAFSQLELTDMQAWNEIASAVGAGVDEATITAYNRRYDALLDRMIEARTASLSAEDEDASDLIGAIVEIQSDYDILLRDLQQDRERREFGTASTGLLWGVGIAFAAAGILAWTWKYRQRR